MADIAEAQRLGEQEHARADGSKDFLTSSIRWSFALFGAKDFLMNKQPTFITFSFALIAIFGISSRTTRSGHGTTLIDFAFLVLGCLAVGVAIDSILVNPYIKWIIHGLFVALVATNPNYQQTFQEMQQILKPICGAISSRLGDSCDQVRVAIQNLLKINVHGQEELSMNNNPATPSVGGNGGVAGEDIV